MVGSIQGSSAAGLIREAFEKNYDLRLAVSRVEQERALLGVARSQYYPQVGYGGNISGQQSPLVPNHTYYAYSFTSFWEIDLFGRIRKMNEAQRAVYFSSEEARRDIRLLLMAEVAQGYFQLRALDAQLEISQQSVRVSRILSTFFTTNLKVAPLRGWKYPAPRPPSRMSLP